MSQQLSDNLLATSYLLLWVATLLWYQLRRNTLDGGTTIILSYIGYAVCALFAINDPILSMTFEPLRLFPYIYLYVMLMTALMPAIFFHTRPAHVIAPQNTLMIRAVCCIFIACTVLMIPHAMSTGGSIFDLFTDDTAGQMAYFEQLAEADDAGTSISSLPTVLHNTLFDVAVFMFFYLLTLKEKNRVFIVVLFLAIFFGTISPVIRGQRGSVVASALTTIIGYMCFRQYLSRRINRVAQMAGIAAVVVIALPIIAITVSRFGNRAAGAGAYVNWYVGQGSLYFNNSVLDAGGTRNGDRTMNLFKRMVVPGTPKNYVERRDKYSDLEIDDYYFTTFVGDFVLDYGPVLALVIFVVFNLWVTLHLRPRDGTLRLHQLLLLYFTLCICAQGGMTLFLYSDTGNLKIIVFAMFYAYLRYREALAKKFPLTTTDNPT